MRPRASLKEMRHLEEKSSRGFRFLRQTEDVASVTNSWSIHPKRNPAPSVNPGTEQLWQTTVISMPMAERQKQNAVQRRDPTQKQSRMDLHSHKRLTAIKQRSDTTKHWPSSNGSSHCKLTIWQASSQNSALKRDPPQKPRSDGSQQRAFTPENSDETQQSMSLMKTPMLHQQQTVDSIQYDTSETRSTSEKSDGSQPLNAPINVWQQHHNGSIWCTSIQTNCCSAPRSTSKTKFEGSQQKQLTAPTNHLKEEPSAPQSLSIFDST